MKKHITSYSALRLIACLLALSINWAINAQYLTAHFSLGSLKIAARALSSSQCHRHAAQTLRDHPARSMTHKALQLWSAVKNFNLEIPNQEKLLIDDFLDKHQNKSGIFLPQEKTDLVITACNNFPLHLPLDSHSCEREKAASTPAFPQEQALELPTDKQEFEKKLNLLHEQYKNQPEKLLAALEPLQLSPFICAESARAAQKATPFPRETAAPIELQFLFKQVQREIGVPEARHLPLKYCPSIWEHPHANMVTSPRAVYILMHALNHFEVAQRVSDKSKSDAYGNLRIVLLHEATHEYYNDPFFFLASYASRFPLPLQLMEHRADRRAFETAQCFDCVKTDVLDYGPDYLSEDERLLIARRFKAEGKICPVHQRLNALLPS